GFFEPGATRLSDSPRSLAEAKLCFFHACQFDLDKQASPISTYHDVLHSQSGCVVLSCRCGRTATLKKGGTMDPRHSPCSSTRLVIVITTLSLSMAISCALPSETGRSEQSPGTSVGINHEAMPPPAVPAAGPRFTVFESGQVRPLAISPDKQHLFAVN